MPKKTIYVKDEDLDIFREAKEKTGDSLSSVIAKALRFYLNHHEEIKETNVKTLDPEVLRMLKQEYPEVEKWVRGRCCVCGVLMPVPHGQAIKDPGQWVCSPECQTGWINRAKALGADNEWILAYLPQIAPWM